MVAAYLAMHEAKRNGRNRVATLRQAFTGDAMTRHLGSLGRLRAAMAEDRFELHAQPITGLTSGEVHTTSCCCACANPTASFTPCAFISAAARRWMTSARCSGFSPTSSTSPSTTSRSTVLRPQPSRQQRGPRARQAIVDVARGLHQQTIAEFVGSQEALKLLRDYGVDYAQGFHLGKPNPSR